MKIRNMAPEVHGQVTNPGCEFHSSVQSNQLHNLSKLQLSHFCFCELYCVSGKILGVIFYPPFLDDFNGHSYPDLEVLSYPSFGEVNI